MAISVTTFTFWSVFGPQIIPTAVYQGSSVSLALQLACSVLVCFSYILYEHIYPVGYFSVIYIMLVKCKDLLGTYVLITQAQKYFLVQLTDYLYRRVALECKKN